MKSIAEVLIQIETLDILFANRFIDAYELWSQGMQPTKSRETALEAIIPCNYL
jgi:hypothetical protein